MSKYAFVFPGQGSQHVGMLSDLADEAAPVFNRASEILGYDLWDLVQNGPEERLNQTEFTQPALLTASLALWFLTRDRGIDAPAVVAGHSLGEYSALVAAGVMAFEDAVDIVRQRGRFMQSAVPLGEGSMAAILGLEDEKVIEICNQLAGREVIQAANFNAPGQVVVAGHVGALKRVVDACQEAGARRAMQLAVSAPFHCALMQPAADNMESLLADVPLNKPEIPVIQNVHADFSTDTDTIRANLVAQISSAVQWTDTIQRITSSGIDRIIECGPGRILSGLSRRINKSILSGNISSRDSLNNILQELD